MRTIQKLPDGRKIPDMHVRMTGSACVSYMGGNGTKRPRQESAVIIGFRINRLQVQERQNGPPLIMDDLSLVRCVFLGWLYDNIRSPRVSSIDVNSTRTHQFRCRRLKASLRAARPVRLAVVDVAAVAAVDAAVASGRSLGVGWPVEERRVGWRRRAVGCLPEDAESAVHHLRTTRELVVAIVGEVTEV